MTKRNFAVDHLRILGMLGVLAIHVGSFSVNIPNFSPILFFILEIFSRYSIPVFFFISGFGLFSKINLQQPFEYKQFIKQKLKNLLLPYLSWSLFYYLFFFDINTRKLYIIAGYIHAVLLGYACYHLYFMLLLIIFYLTMPLWIKLLREINNTPCYAFTLLFIFQVAFNFADANFVSPVENHLLNTLINFRLNFLIPHYLFIFMLGAYIGNNYKIAFSYLHLKQKTIFILFFICLLNLIYNYYYLLSNNNPLEITVNTLQQLSLPGFLFTTTAILAAFIYLSKNNLATQSQSLLAFSAKASNIVYFIHPLFLYFITSKLNLYQVAFNEGIALVTYTMVLSLSLLSAKLYYCLRKPFFTHK